MNQKEIDEITAIELDYEKAEPFLHCEHCLRTYLQERERNGGESPKSPRDTFHYEMSGYPLELPNGEKVGIVVLWCKNCGKPVWDSRHLAHKY